MIFQLLIPIIVLIGSIVIVRRHFLKKLAPFMIVGMRIDDEVQNVTVLLVHKKDKMLTVIDQTKKQHTVRFKDVYLPSFRE